MRTQASRALLLWSVLCSSVPPSSATGMSHLIGVDMREAPMMLPAGAQTTSSNRQEIQRGTRDDLDESSYPQAEDEFGLPMAPTYKGVPTEGNRIDRWKQEAVALAASDHGLDPPSSTLGAEHPNNEFSRFSEAFSEAKVPDCLRKDGLKRQPPRILFFAFQGVLAFPFVALAKIRGKCL